MLLDFSQAVIQILLLFNMHLITALSTSIQQPIRLSLYRTLFTLFGKECIL